SAPNEPYLNCSSSLAKTCFSWRKNFTQVKRPPSASRRTKRAPATQRIRRIFGEQLIFSLPGADLGQQGTNHHLLCGVTAPGYNDWAHIVRHTNSKCFQIFDDSLFLRRGQRGAIGWAFVANIRVAFVALPRRQADRSFPSVETKIVRFVLRIIEA